MNVFLWNVYSEGITLVTFLNANTMTSTRLNLLGRIIFSLPFIFFGLYRFWNMDFFINLSPDWLPLPELWTSLVGFGLIAASFSIIFNKYAHLASLMLAAMIVVLASSVHVPNTISNWNDPALRSISMALAMKDFTMAGGALIIASMTKPQKITNVRKTFSNYFLNDRNEPFSEERISA